MNDSTLPKNLSRPTSPVRVIGIGDTGVRSVTGFAERLRGVAEVICIDTDSTSLRKSGVTRNLLIGEESFNGFGSGGDVTAAKQAAQAESDALRVAIAGAKSVVILAGMGGGTGSGVAPVVAEVAKSEGAHTFSIVSMPFDFEGIRRDAIAQEALNDLKLESDVVAPLANDRLLVDSEHGSTMAEALGAGRESVRDLVAAFATLFSTSRGYSHVTPGHVLSVLSNNSLAYVGVGGGSGITGAASAAEIALDSAAATTPEQAERAILLIESGQELSLSQVASAMGTVQAKIGSDTEIHLGVRKSRGLGDKVKVTLLTACRERRRPQILTDREVLAQNAAHRKLTAALR